MKTNKSGKTPTFTWRLKDREQLEKEAALRKPPLNLAMYLQHLVDTHPERKKQH